MNIIRWIVPRKNRFAAGLMALAMLFTSTVITDGAAHAYSSPDPNVYGNTRFWTGNICMAIGDASIEAAYNAQVWNNATQNVSITAKNNCASAGYPPSRRFTIDTFYDRSRGCTEESGVNGLGTNYSWDGPVNGWLRYTNNPIVWVNRVCSGHAIGSVQLRHYVSQAIGLALGLRVHDSDGWNSRVMNQTLWSSENVSGPNAAEAKIVSDVYGGIYG